ncbi:MAG TPA: ABC transporter substrate-binding protein [Streptosporangiaceae bacterium]|jgi:NitT/TauT family transport system substrate-binding protein
MRSPRLGRITVTATAGLAVGLLAVGCSSSGSSGSTSSGSSASPSSAKLEQSSITVGALPVVDSAGLYLANKLGYFKQEGLTVKIAPVTQSTQAIPDMLHGTIAIIGGANYVSFIEAQAKGTAQFKVVAEGVTCKPNTFGVAVLPSSGITTPADLAGKTVAVNLTNNIQTLTLNAVLKADGVDPSKVKYVVIPFPNMVTALKAKQVNAISAVEPFLGGALAADGAKQVVSSCDGPVANMPMSGYLATSAWTQKNPNTAKAFQTALLKAQAYANANPSAVKAILPTYTKVTAAQANALPLNNYPSTLDPAEMTKVLTVMKSGGLATGSATASTLLYK